MLYSHHHRDHGNITVGRITVAVACVIVLGTNGYIFKQAAARPNPVLGLELAMVLSLIWMLAGAWGMCTRQGWGRALTLAILYFLSFGLFLTAIIAFSMDSGPLTDRVKPMAMGVAVYLISSLALTFSKDVRRLTSRALE